MDSTEEYKGCRNCKYQPEPMQTCDWIKDYCIKRNIEFYNKAIDDFVKFASDMPTVETEDGEVRPMWLEEMAERLKVGDKNAD